MEIMMDFGMVQVRGLSREKCWTWSLSMWSILSNLNTWHVAHQLQSLVFLLSSGGQEDCILSYEPVTRQESKFHLLFYHSSLCFSFQSLGASRAVSLALPVPVSPWLLFLRHSVYFPTNKTWCYGIPCKPPLPNIPRTLPSTFSQALLLQYVNQSTKYWCRFSRFTAILLHGKPLLFCFLCDMFHRPG